jgi:hypothetical protein
MAGDIGAGIRAGTVAGTDALLLPHGDELIAAFVQAREALAVEVGGLARAGAQALRHGREHLCVDGVGFGEEAGGAGEVSGAGRIDAGEGDLRLRGRAGGRRHSDR